MAAVAITNSSKVAQPRFWTTLQAVGSSEPRIPSGARYRTMAGTPVAAAGTAASPSRALPTTAPTTVAARACHRPRAGTSRAPATSSRLTPRLPQSTAWSRKPPLVGQDRLDAPLGGLLDGEGPLASRHLALPSPVLTGSGSKGRRPSQSAPPGRCRRPWPRRRGRIAASRLDRESTTASRRPVRRSSARWRAAPVPRATVARTSPVTSSRSPAASARPDRGQEHLDQLGRGQGADADHVHQVAVEAGAGGPPLGGPEQLGTGLGDRLTPDSGLVAGEGQARARPATMTASSTSMRRRRPGTRGSPAWSRARPSRAWSAPGRCRWPPASPPGRRRRPGRRTARAGPPSASGSRPQCGSWRSRCRRPASRASCRRASSAGSHGRTWFIVWMAASGSAMPTCTWQPNTTCSRNTCR